jgi:Fur family transcriptional regulator, ferric uptake regulator
MAAQIQNQSRQAELERRCADNQLRMTAQRRVVLRVLADANDHPDVEELHRRAHAIDADVSLATVYRNLKLLEAIGVLKRHAFADGRSRYEVTPAHHHDHLIDIESGKVIEFRSPEIERLQEAIAKKHGYRIVDHRLEIYVTPLTTTKKDVVD